MVICLEQGADLHMAQLMPLPLTVSCLTKNQIGFTFLVPAHIGADFRFEVPGQSSVGLIGGGRGQWFGGHHGECGARAYNGGLGAEPPAGSRGRGHGGEAP